MADRTDQRDDRPDHRAAGERCSQVFVHLRGDYELQADAAYSLAAGEFSLQECLACQVSFVIMSTKSIIQGLIV